MGAIRPFSISMGAIAPIEPPPKDAPASCHFFSFTPHSATSPEVPYHTNNSFHHNNSQKSGSISTTISTSSTTVTTTTISSVESTVTSKVYKVNPKTTELPLVAKNVTSKIASKEVKKSSEDPHRAPKSIVHPRNPDNRLLLRDRPFHLSATTTQPVIHTSTLTDTQWAILQFRHLQLI